MKTLNFITRILFAAIIMVSMSSTLEAQKAYHKRPIENGITELNNLANRLIEKCKVKFDLTNSVIVKELELTNEASTLNELNEITDQLIENVRFDTNNTISVNEAGSEYSELDMAADEMMVSIKFDVNQTISVTEEMSENSELEQLTNDLIETVKFDVNQTISVSGLDSENPELNQLTDNLIENIAKFDLSKTNTIQDDQLAIVF